MMARSGTDAGLSSVSAMDAITDMGLLDGEHFTKSSDKLMYLKGGGKQQTKPCSEVSREGCNSVGNARCSTSFVYRIFSTGSDTGM